MLHPKCPWLETSYGDTATPARDMAGEENPASAIASNAIRNTFGHADKCERKILGRRGSRSSGVPQRSVADLSHVVLTMIAG